MSLCNINNEADHPLLWIMLLNLELYYIEALLADVALRAGLNRKLIIPLPGTLAPADPSFPTVTATSLMSCVLSVYHALMLGFTNALPVRLIESVCALVPVLMI